MVHQGLPGFVCLARFAQRVLTCVLPGLTGRRGEGRSVFSAACFPWPGWCGFALDLSLMPSRPPETCQSDPSRAEAGQAHTSLQATGSQGHPGQARSPLVSLLCRWPRHAISGKLCPGICSGRRVPSSHHQLIGTFQREIASVCVPCIAVGEVHTRRVEHCDTG